MTVTGNVAGTADDSGGEIYSSGDLTIGGGRFFGNSAGGAIVRVSGSQVSVSARSERR